MAQENTAQRKDDFEAIVDGVVADRGQATELKSALRRRFRIVERGKADATPPGFAEEDDDDLWNNVPV